MAVQYFNPLNAELNPICHLLALLGGATIVDVSRLRVNSTLINVGHECICPHPYQLAIHNHPFNFSFHVNYANDTVALHQTNCEIMLTC
jgi:hypothetical protein